MPREREALEALPGVGRKTANVVMSVAFGEAAFAVDTHVFRVSHRLGLTLGTTPRDVEDDVTKLVPREKWRHAHHWLILHGREICKAPTPLCGQLSGNDVSVARARRAGARRPKAGAVTAATAAAGRGRRGAPAAAAPRPRQSSSKGRSR